MSYACHHTHRRADCHMECARHIGRDHFTAGQVGLGCSLTEQARVKVV
jgi:hypothetical protein